MLPPATVAVCPPLGGGAAAPSSGRFQTLENPVNEHVQQLRCVQARDGLWVRPGVWLVCLLSPLKAPQQSSGCGAASR